MKKLIDVQSITDLPQQQKIHVFDKAADDQPLQTEMVFVVRVTREERLKGGDRLVIGLLHDKNRQTSPGIKIKPGMRLKITTFPVDPDWRQKGGGNGKK